MSISISYRGAPEAEILNVSNANFRSLAELAGLDVGPDLCGSWDPSAIRDRVVFALDSVRAMPELDGGSPDRLITGPGALLIDCGRRPGYYTERLTLLLRLVDGAIGAGEILTYD